MVQTFNAQTAQDTLNNLRGIYQSRPLTDDERRQGRRAALLLMAENRKKMARTQKGFFENQIKYYCEHGYSLAEAKEAIRLDEQEHRERIGMGKSYRCRFVQLQ